MTHSYGFSSVKRERLENDPLTGIPPDPLVFERNWLRHCDFPLREEKVNCDPFQNSDLHRLHGHPPIPSRTTEVLFSLKNESCAELMIFHP